MWIAQVGPRQVIKVPSNAVDRRRTSAREVPDRMLKLSDILVYNKELESFEDLLPAVQEVARQGERFFRIDVKPPFSDTPDDWEDRLEAAFSGLIR